MSEPLTKGLMIDGFEILETISDSVRGTVYKVKPALLASRVYALKIAKPGSDEKILNERMALEKIGRKPHIVELFFAGTDSSNNPYIVEDYLPSNLAEVLSAKQRKTLDHADALSITKQILIGLTHAHDQNIVHRDLKPENVLVEKKPRHYYRVRLCDFGLAAIKNTEPVLESSLDDNTSSAGTLRYLSPEQKDNGTVTKKTDIYAVGLILYEMLTGKLPQINYPKTSAVHIPSKTSLAVMRDAWGWVDDIIDKALQPNPSNRYASASAMLKAIADGMEPKPEPEPKGPGFIERAGTKIKRGLKASWTGAKVVLSHVAMLPIYVVFLPLYFGCGASKFLENKFRYSHDEIGFFSAIVLAVAYYFILPAHIGEEYLKYHLTQNPTNGTIIAFHDDGDQGNKHFLLIDASKLPEISKIKVAAPDVTSSEPLYTISDDGNFFYYTTSNSLVEVNIKGKQRKTLAKSEILGRFNRIIHQNDRIYALLDTEVWSVSKKDGLKQHSNDLDALEIPEMSLDKGPYQLDRTNWAFSHKGLEFQFKDWYLVGNFVLDEKAKIFSWLDTSAPFN